MLGRAARAVGAAIIVAHHMNKASMGPNAPTDPRALVRGSTAIVAAADYVYAMTGGRGEPKLIAQAKGRSLEIRSAMTSILRLGPCESKATATRATSPTRAGLK